MGRRIDAGRRRIKQRVFRQRGGTCVLCGAPATDLHEIINRGRTLKDSVARELSFADPIVAPLCNTCNLGADNNETRLALLKLNVKFYGRMAVEKAIRDVYDAMTVKQSIEAIMGLLEALDE